MLTSERGECLISRVSFPRIITGLHKLHSKILVKCLAGTKSRARNHNKKFVPDTPRYS